MQISELELSSDVRVVGDAGVDVTGVSLDSRSVSPGDLYAALPGANVHGAEFAPELITAGVKAVLTDDAGLARIRESMDSRAAGVTFLVAAHPRAHLGHIAARIHGTDPGHPQLLGVTGTNGKTTTTYMLNGLLTALGRTTGVIGTVATLIAGRQQSSVRTTPEAPELHGLFARMREAGVDTCAMEVSSHALAQHRVDGAHFRVAGFTNLSQDHLDYHRTMEEYFRAKAQLFTPEFADSGVIVLADDWSRRLAAEAAVPVVTIGRDPAEQPDYLLSDGLASDGAAGAFELTGQGTTLAARSPLPGDFNVLNAALALVMLLRLGVPEAELAAHAQTFEAPVPGRMEVVHAADPRVIVDYSHTPDAIAQALGGLHDVPGRLAIVFGAGGDRDRGKRQAMGRAAAREADVVIVTDDNPRSEDPAAIRSAVLAGVHEALDEGTARVRADEVREIGARSQAIAAGIAAAGPGGTLVIAGKGHETGQDIAGVVHPFDDREQTRVALASGGSAGGPGKVRK